MAVPALAVVAGASSFITLLVAGGHATTAGSGHAAAGAPLSGQHATVGTLAAQNGSSWVVKTAKGKSVTVRLGSSTTFGTKAHPSSESAFHTGSRVKVLGTATGATVDANRVVVLGATSGSAAG